MRNFVFTSYNVENLYAPPLSEALPEEIQYILIGREVCPSTGKKHLQGYCQLKSNLKLGGCKRVIKDNTAHIEEAKGSFDENYKYCTKEGNFYEHGTPKKRGARSDLRKLRETIDQADNMSDVIESITPEQYIRFHSGIEKYYNIVKNAEALEEAKQDYAPESLLAWQSMCIEDIQSLPRRKISWYWEPTGGVGKSYLATHMALHYNALVLTTTSYKDCTFLYDRHPFVIFDLTRNEFDPNYTTIEAFANTLLTSTKYCPITKISRARVLVLSNSEPNLQSLSADRWNVKNISHLRQPPGSG